MAIVEGVLQSLEVFSVGKVGSLRLNSIFCHVG
jgi:hypothetical protein